MAEPKSEDIDEELSEIKVAAEDIMELLASIRSDAQLRSGHTGEASVRDWHPGQLQSLNTRLAMLHRRLEEVNFAFQSRTTSADTATETKKTATPPPQPDELEALHASLANLTTTTPLRRSPRKPALISKQAEQGVDPALVNQGPYDEVRLDDEDFEDDADENDKTDNAPPTPEEEASPKKRLGRRRSGRGRGRGGGGGGGRARSSKRKGKLCTKEPDPASEDDGEEVVDESDPGRKACRLVVDKYDSSVRLPRVENLPVLEDVAARLVGWIRSRSALLHARTLFMAARGACENFNVDVQTDLDAGDAGEAWLDKVTFFIRFIDRAKDRENVSKIKKRICQWRLFETAELKRNLGGSHISREDLDELVRQSGVKKVTVKKWLQKGKKLYGMCGGHEGLLVLLPMTGSWGFTAKEIWGLRVAQAAAMSPWMQDDLARALCGAGSMLIELIARSTDKEPAAILKPLLTMTELSPAEQLRVGQGLAPCACQCAVEEVEEADESEDSDSHSDGDDMFRNDTARSEEE